MLISRKTRTLAVLGAAGAATGVALAGTAGTVAAGVLLARALCSRPVPEDAVVLITGGSRGLGLAIASRFARRRVRLVLAARHRDELERAQSDLIGKHPHLHPDDFYLVAADLSQPAECDRLVSETLERYGRIDVLVNNAAIMEVGPIEAQTTEAFERAMRINFFAALYTTWAALPHLRTQTPLPGWSRRAAIVNIASIGGKFAVPHMLPYSASKFALVGFSEGLHTELRHKGIRVTTVCPGLMRTGGEEYAQFVGNVEAERRWFQLAAKTPILTASTSHAASRIYSAVAHGCAEITITPQAWILARKVGAAPAAMQFAASLANEYVLPSAPTANDAIAGESTED
ncbi:MAG TPA: SDR family oxidoreductase [Acidobacteriaceae bacterium]|jgi:NAD(P)-dependent dehydrogenase (short-subunit alcohol dehydrogenase family)